MNVGLPPRFTQAQSRSATVRRLHFFCRLSLAALIGGVATVGSAQQNKPERLPQSHREVVDAGRTLFQKEWVHTPPDIPEQGTLTDNQYRAKLTSLSGDGLGPMFNAKSCEDCHAGGAGADVDRNVTLITLDPRSPAIVRVANRAFGRAATEKREEVEKVVDDLFPGFISPNGVLSMDVVVHESSSRPFYKPIRDQLAEGVTDGIDAEWFDCAKRTSQAIADRPVIAGRRGELDFYLSQRNSPPLFGLGLIDRIAMSRLMNIARVQAARSKGKVTGRVGDGKFGWRAQTTSLSSFVMGACAGELGLQVPGTPQPPDTADISYVSLGQDLDQNGVRQLVAYVGSLPAPIQERTQADHWAGVRQGKRLFAQAGCAVCHVESVSPARGIFSDLLLHDMGDLLQAPSPSSRGRLQTVSSIAVPRFPRDNRPFGSGRSVASYYGGGSSIGAFAFARPVEPKFPYGRLPVQAIDVRNGGNVMWDSMQREWRTPPLWGVADSAPYLHDGRATTLRSAILWHGGEASESIEKFRSLSKSDGELVIQFLKSLRAPATPRLPDSIFPQEPEEKELANRFVSDESDTPASDDLLDVFRQAY
ncbi:di-heme oxidoredictase family protein [Stieleria marina]